MTNRYAGTMLLRLAVPFLLAGGARADLTPDQKVFEFQSLASVYIKNYAPYQWKKLAFNFDMLIVGPWVDRVRRSKDDLEFYEICSEYVSNLQDAHSTFGIPSDFVAQLGFFADIYDGKLLIDELSRQLLPARDYPFQIGDEVVSIDGKPALSVAADFERYAFASSPVTRRRFGAEFVGYRPQSTIPRAHEIGDKAVVEIRRQNGALETYEIPWRKSGTPFLRIGPAPSPSVNSKPQSKAAAAARRWEDATPVPPGDEPPSLFAPLTALARERVPTPLAEVRGLGSFAPVFTPPSNFRRRANQFYYSGVFDSGGLQIGYLRIGDFDPFSVTTGLRQIETEIAFFQTSTDGLIIDVTRNPGGNGCYAEEVARRLIPDKFNVLGREVRSTLFWIVTYSSILEQAKAQRAEPYVITQLTDILKQMQTAYSENGGHTGPVPLCASTLETFPAVTVYRKPIMVLTDDMTISAAEDFAGILQDAGRARFFGSRTMGAGGGIRGFAPGVYSEMSATATVYLLNRAQMVVADGYPTSRYIENVGVRPEINYDFMTKDNLLGNGKPFVDAFLAAMADYIKKNP